MKSLFNYIFEADQSHLKYRFKEKYDALYSKINHFFTPKHSILVVSMCGASKRKDSKKEKVEARTMYEGPANLTLLKVLPNLPVDWIIFSGGYGLMNLTTKINYYTDVIMDLSSETLLDMRDYLRYNDDLKKIIKAGHFKKIIFTISDRWMLTLNLKEIGEAAGSGCQIYGFLSDTRLNDKDFEKPENFTNIELKKSYFLTFSAATIYLKEKITTEYLKYIHENSDITLLEFLNRKNK